MKKFENGALWNDINGEPIHAHGGCIITHGGYYYWYGEDRRDNCYVSCYRSKDLLNWEFRSHSLTADSGVSALLPENEAILKNRDGSKVNLERPKVLYNEKTKKFVMWLHFENGRDYSCAAAAVASCDAVDGSFTYHGHFRPCGNMSRDCTLFKDDDATAYFISTARDNADLHIYRLTEDYMSVEKLVNKLWIGERREAPAVVKTDNRYYMLTSYCTGWEPNQAKYGFSDSIEGKWSGLYEIGDSTTFKSQPAFIIQKDGNILYFGDRWGGDGENYFNSGYVVYPLIEENNGLTLKYTAEAAIYPN